jgi:hypothetical protein
MKAKKLKPQPQTSRKLDTAAPQVVDADLESCIQTFESTINQLKECCQHNSRFY